MNVGNNFSYNQTFTSRANPIKPFVVKTKFGDLNVAEASAKDYKRNGFFENLSEFFCRNFASNTNDKEWLSVYNSAAWHKTIVKNFADFLKTKCLSKDKNLTLLLAKDRRQRIRGACLSYAYNEVPTAHLTTLYFDSLAVDKPFRGVKLGKIMLQKSEKANRKSFTDVFLTGEIRARGFYEKQGYVELNPDDEVQNTVIKRISRYRKDYPKYVNLLTKPIQPNAERWYVSASDAIKNDKNHFLD